MLFASSNVMRTSVKVSYSIYRSFSEVVYNVINDAESIIYFLYILYMMYNESVKCFTK